jgi:hypothetical protein
MIPEAIWTLLCPGANGRRTGERFCEFLTFATMRRAAAKDNLRELAETSGREPLRSKKNAVIVLPERHTR